MEKQSKRKVWIRFIATNIAMLACFLLVYYISAICKPITRLVACILYALLWGMNSGMLFYQNFKAKDPIAFSHSRIARIINNITIIGVVALCAIFFGIS